MELFIRPEGLKPEMSGIFVDKECYNLALFFFKQQQVTHHTQLACLSFIWQETQDLWVSANAMRTLRMTSVVGV